LSSTSANAYTVTALAHRFGCDKDTIYALIRSGRLPAFNIAKPGSKRATWRVSASAVDDFDRGQTTTKPPTKRRKSRAKQAADFVRYY
jgi:excisionase family DNA binding protein